MKKFIAILTALITGGLAISLVNALPNLAEARLALN
jgi:hypothetical protein